MRFSEEEPNFNTPDEETHRFEPPDDGGHGKDSPQEDYTESPCANPPRWMEWEVSDSNR